MSLGYDVNKGTLDMKAAQAVLMLRQSFDEVRAVANWLANHPSNGTDPDPLTQDPFGYTADEVYILRSFFETMETVRTANEATFETGRKITGLE
jgi:hypothetical protein